MATPPYCSWVGVKQKLNHVVWLFGFAIWLLAFPNDRRGRSTSQSDARECVNQGAGRKVIDSNHTFVSKQEDPGGPTRCGISTTPRIYD